MTVEHTPEEEDLLAAEFALGLLEGEDLANAQRRAVTDPHFSQLLTKWEVRLATLAEDLAPEEPSSAAKQRLLDTLFPQAKPVRWWDRIGIWQATSALCLAALVALFAAGLELRPATTGPLYTSEITSTEGDFRVIAVVDKSTNEVILTKTAGAAPAGRILQVWAHGENAPAISVGLWPEGDSVRLPMPPVIAAVEGVLTLGVSEEPVGGSPTGSPSGRVFGTVDIPGVKHPL